MGCKSASHQLFPRRFCGRAISRYSKKPKFRLLNGKPCAKNANNKKNAERVPAFQTRKVIQRPTQEDCFLSFARWAVEIQNERGTDIPVLHRDLFILQIETRFSVCFCGPGSGYLFLDLHLTLSVRIGVSHQVFRTRERVYL